MESANKHNTSIIHVIPVNHVCSILASGRNITICTLSNGMEILNGSMVKMSNCRICTCNETELTCCGYVLKIL